MCYALGLRSGTLTDDFYVEFGNHQDQRPLLPYSCNGGSDLGEKEEQWHQLGTDMARLKDSTMEY